VRFYASSVQYLVSQPDLSQFPRVLSIHAAVTIIAVLDADFVSLGDSGLEQEQSLRGQKRNEKKKKKKERED
jgi:hypothetical protein